MSAKDEFIDGAKEGLFSNWGLFASGFAVGIIAGGTASTYNYAGANAALMKFAGTILIIPAAAVLAVVVGGFIGALSMKLSNSKGEE